ncbi:MAG: hypothetical protein AB1716_03680 [Planctomycetota bacterium]
MEALKVRLERVLRELPDGQTHLEELPNGHVCGHVISSAFEDRDYEDRRKMIRQKLDEALAANRLRYEDMTLISTLLTYTPEEWAVNPIEQ